MNFRVQNYRDCLKFLIAMGSILSIFLILILFGLFALEKAMTPKISEVTDELEISIKSRAFAYEPLVIAPYKTMEVFISEEKISDFSFTSVGATWDEFAPDGTRVEVEVRFKVDGKWTKWVELEEEEDAINEDHDFFEKKYAMASLNTSNILQYKYLLYGDGIKKPTVRNPKWTFIRSAKPVFASQNFSDQPMSGFSGSVISQASINSAIISRALWGADESYRYLNDNSVDADLIEIDEEYLEKYKDELTYSKVITQDSAGKKYKWPLQYPKNVSKFIIHHTATSSNLDNPKQAIRDIYYYHAVSRAWGDIGYNYVIDQQGKIYEGRFGGEGVIGAHSGPGNNGSIGIAVLGNFEENQVPQPVLNAIADLIQQKSKIHKIIPDGYSPFRGKLMPNIFGHRDIMPTSCPGKNLYDKLALIRQTAGKAVTEKNKFVKDYDYQDLTNMPYLELKPAEKKSLTISLENIGKQNWDSKTFLVVNKNPKFEGIISFPGTGNIVTAEMNETLVKPGAKATFTLPIQAHKKSDVVMMDMAPVVNGTKKIESYIKLPVAVQQTLYQYDFVSAKYPPSVMKRGAKFSGSVKLKNTGNISWTQSGDHQVVLKADHPQNRKSPLFKNLDIIAYLNEKEVKPGATGTFNFNVLAPAQAGNYQEYFTPYIPADDLWLNDNNLYFSTMVLYTGNRGEVIFKSHASFLKQGNNYGVELSVKNIGTNSWDTSKMKISFNKSSKTEIGKSTITPKIVKPGEIAKINFSIKPGLQENTGKRIILLNLGIEDKKIFSKSYSLIYKVVANGKNAQKNKNGQNGFSKTEDPAIDTTTPKAPAVSPNINEPDIRIKLSFKGNPEISANSGFSLYSGTKKLASLSANDIVSVEKSGNFYKITAKNQTYNETSPVRLIPENGGILKINNYYHAPAWNPELNDNLYRGILEVRSDNDSLIVINELPLESYLRGLGEISNGENTEKIKTIMVAARTYAKFYLSNSKFPGKPYNLDDDPEVSQKYLGYGMEMRSPNVTNAVLATSGEVVVYQGKVVKTPYFNQSDGTFTRSAKDVWGWTDTPYLMAVSDFYCKADKFLGHGVGLSGCGAKGMAEAGLGYKQILQHYYTGVEIQKIY